MSTLPLEIVTPAIDAKWVPLVEEMITPLLGQTLPVLVHSEITEESPQVKVSALLPSEQKVGRFLGELLCRYLVPGKILSLLGGMSLEFRLGSDLYFFRQDLISLASASDRFAAQIHLPILAKELKNNGNHSSIFLPPVFMPRNEEEMLRSIVVLSRQFRFVDDLPQAIVQYDSQNESDLIFTVLLVRLLRSKTSRLETLIAPSLLPIHVEEVRKAGLLKKKTVKEAAILRVKVAKGPLFRLDGAVDIPRGRAKVVAELERLFGPFRDYNGGMIGKQEEVLRALETQIGIEDPAIELILQNFFYSIRPGIMKTLLPIDSIKRLFLLLLEKGAPFEHEGEAYHWKESPIHGRSPSSQLITASLCQRGEMRYGYLVRDPSISL